jgi:hypothetical protein
MAATVATEITATSGRTSSISCEPKLNELEDDAGGLESFDEYEDL